MRTLIICIILAFPGLVLAQQTDTLLHKLDSLEKKADTIKQTNIIKPEAYNDTTKITRKVYFALLASGMKQQLATPFTMSSKSWVKVAKFGVLLGGLMFADEPVQQEVVDWRKNSLFAKNAASYLTNFGGVYEGAVLGALATYGYAFKNEKIKTTSLLATQAYLTAEVTNQLIKRIAGRQRPSVYDKNRIESEPTFKGPFAKAGRDQDGNKLAASFPSGHAQLAFAAATVYAMEYKDRPLIPILSYSGATLISLSRIVENAHWVTDIFVGATLGYLTGKQVVNNYHRYAKIQDAKANELPKRRRKNRVSFNMQYTGFGMQPGLVWKPVRN